MESLSSPLVISWLILFAVAALSFAGGLLQATTGFGCGLILMATLPSIMGGVMPVSIMGNVAGFGSALMVVLVHWRKTRIKTVLALLPAYFIAMPLGNRLIMELDDGIMKTILGIVLILYASYNLFVKEIRFRTSLPKAVAAGGLSGLLSGMFALSGPPIVVYVINDTDDKDVYIATTHAFFLVGSLYSFGVRVVNGLVTSELLIYAAVTFAAISAGTLFGEKLRAKINMNRMKKWIFALIVILGISMFFR